MKPYSLIAITPAFKDYAWGQLGKCWVRNFAGERATDSTPCAEIWFGDHSNGPAAVHLDGKEYSLPELLTEKPSLNGGKAQLSFLAKVLSIGKPLSIQLHPRTNDAQRLHKEQPTQYPDEGQKDEAAVALSKTRLLYGFRKKEEIILSLQQHGELSNFCQDIQELSEDAFNKSICEKLFQLKTDELETLCNSLSSKLAASSIEKSVQDSLFLEISKEFGEGDVGLIFCYLLNYVELEEGESLAIPASRPHAYLSGEILEIMRPSDNVIRCGLTPKFKDPTEIASCAEFSSIKLHKDAVSSPYSFHNGSLGIQLLGPEISHCRASGEAQIVVNLDAQGKITSGETTEELKGQECFLLASGEEAELSLKSGRVIIFSAS